MLQQFPRTEVAGISMPRMIMGSNWVLGFSHTGVAADNYIKQINYNREAIAAIAERFLAQGVDAAMAPMCDNSCFPDGLKLAEDRLGKKIIKVDTPILNVDDNAAARHSAEVEIKKSAAAGATFCLIHHSSAEQLVNKNLRAMPRLPDYLSMIRDAGMIPGLSAHMPELILYPDANEYDVQTYIQIYNCMGFMMQVEIEGVHRIIENAKHPVMTIKSMAAGRCTPFVGLSFSYATLRPCDMVTVGAFTPDEVHEDVEIALAAIERRHPNLSARNSPAVTSIIKG